jgi:predicted enzyme related to lactoylglutathione lyase
MTTPLQGLRTVIHPVADLAGAKVWFTDLLGYGPYFDEPFYVGFEVAGYELGLFPAVGASDGALVYWGVPDVAAAVADAVGLGATVHTAASEVGGGIVTATVTTPQGSIVGFIDNPHFRARDVSS